MAQYFDPFTEEEVYQALRLVLPEDEARRAARPLPDPTPTEVAALRPGEYVVRGVNYTDDMLILLSLVSSDLSAKVETYRATRRRIVNWSDEEDEAWRARRDELKRSIAGGLRAPP
jgi:hypothetical protein